MSRFTCVVSCPCSCRKKTSTRASEWYKQYEACVMEDTLPADFNHPNWGEARKIADSLTGKHLQDKNMLSRVIHRNGSLPWGRTSLGAPPYTWSPDSPRPQCSCCRSSPCSGSGPLWSQEGLTGWWCLGILKEKETSFLRKWILTCLMVNALYNIHFTTHWFS